MTRKGKIMFERRKQPVNRLKLRELSLEQREFMETIICPTIDIHSMSEWSEEERKKVFGDYADQIPGQGELIGDPDFTKKLADILFKYEQEGYESTQQIS
jgi:hypothetical protein